MDLNINSLSEKFKFEVFDRNESFICPISKYLGKIKINLKKNIISYNREIVSNLGYEFKNNSPEDFFLLMWDSIKEPDIKKLNKILEKLEKNKSINSTIKIQTKSFTEIFINYFFSIKVDYDKKNKNIEGITLETFDITNIIKLQEELAEKNEVITNLMKFDNLTNLYTHKEVYERLQEEIKRANRYKTELTILSLDIDDFKKINEKYGHKFGNKIIKKVAEIIQQNIREVDIAGRFGGEEFLIIYPNTNINEAIISAERIRMHVETELFPKDLNITISGGMKEYITENAPKLIEEANKRLYVAKNKGKNQIVVI